MPSPFYFRKEMKESFRNYSPESLRDKCIYDHYKEMRKKQTLAFLSRMEDKWFGFDHGKMSIRDAFDALGSYVDSSDPDTSVPNIEHAFQTAEAIRADGKPDWFQLVGLIHDLGKIMFLWGEERDGQVGEAGGPQWGIAGDTWVLGMKIPDCVVFPELNVLSGEDYDSLPSSDLGIYEEGCGLDRLKFAFGHDEYMYRLLLNAKCSIPEAGLQMVRLHSCYPLHREGAYDKLLKPGDSEILDYVREFNTYDLYTKRDIRPDLQQLWPYYELLIKKYIPGELRW